MDSNGFFFERLIEAILLELGLANRTRNIVRQIRGRHLQEIDHVLNHSGRLLILDCKLIGEDGEEERGEPITSQIRQAAQTQRELGGLGAKLLMIRPNRVLNAEELALAEASRLTVIDRDGTIDTFSRLAQFLGVHLPASLQQAASKVRQAWERDRIRPFSQSRLHSTYSANEAGSSDAIVDLDAYQRQFEGQDWVAWMQGQQVNISARAPSGLTRTEVEDLVRRSFQNLGLVDCTLSGTGRSCVIVLQRRRDTWAALRAFLESRLRRELLP